MYCPQCERKIREKFSDRWLLDQIEEAARDPSVKPETAKRAREWVETMRSKYPELR